MKPICFPCQRFFRPKKSGFYFTEGMPAPGESRPEPGTAEPDKWVPYKVWSGDLWECEGCGATIISGVGQRPLAIQHEQDFHSLRERVHAENYQVNDC